MRTLFVTDPPQAVEDWLARRRALGQDLYDEVWEGEYHVAPAPRRRHARVQAALLETLGPLARRAGLEATGPCNIGRPDDFRVPDLACFREPEDLTWNPTAAIVAEVVSVGDESRLKSDFYLRAGVEEILIVDPHARTAEWFGRGDGAFRRTDRSAILGIASAELFNAIDRPA
jgi:Uma2 family endonuclease